MTSNEEYFSDSETDNVDVLYNKCINAKPVTRSQTNSALKSNKKPYTVTHTGNKKAEKSLPPDFLQIDEGNNNMDDLMENVSSELKNDMNNMSSKLNKLLQIMSAMRVRVESLENKVAHQDQVIQGQSKQIARLENQYEEMERKSRQNKVLLTDNVIKASSQALHADVLKLFTDKLKLSTKELKEFSVTKFGKSPHTVLVEFESLNAKKTLFKTLRNVRTETPEVTKDFFINDFLTKKRTELLKHARQLKKEEVLASAYSFEGNVYNKHEEDSDSQRVLSLSDFNKQTYMLYKICVF